MKEQQPVVRENRTTELPRPNMDIFEVESTLKFISECKSEGVDCHELEEYIAPLTHSNRVNLSYECPYKLEPRE